MNTGASAETASPFLTQILNFTAFLKLHSPMFSRVYKA
jgi:hypothetical protein